MKPTTFILLLLLFTSCQKEECWTFSLVTTTSASPDNSDFPINSTSRFVQCGITKKEAKEVAESYTNTRTETIGGTTYTYKTVCYANN